jgi:hypothetical protein
MEAETNNHSPKIPDRVRWPVAVVIGAYSFFGHAPVEALDWLFTEKGRLALLLAALGIGFWPQLSKWAKEQFLAGRPASKRKLKKNVMGLVAQLREFESREIPLRTKMENEHFQRMTLSINAKDKAETDALWHEQMRERRELDERQALHLREQLGGQLSYAIREFRRRQMLTDSEATKLEWETGNGSPYWVSHATNTLEGMARQL